MRVTGMMRRDAAILDRNDTIQDAAEAMANNDGDAILVTGDGALVGLLTVRDLLLRVVVKGLDPTVTPLFQVMSVEPACCGEDEDAAAALALMAEHQIHHLPVVDDEGRPIGLVAAANAALFPHALDPAPQP